MLNIQSILLNLPKREEKPKKNAFNYPPLEIELTDQEGDYAVVKITAKCKVEEGEKLNKETKQKEKFFRLFSTGYAMQDCEIVNQDGTRTPVKVKLEIAP